MSFLSIKQKQQMISYNSQIKSEEKNETKYLSIKQKKQLFEYQKEKNYCENYCENNCNNANIGLGHTK